MSLLLMCFVWRKKIEYENMESGLRKIILASINPFDWGYALFFKNITWFRICIVSNLFNLRHSSASLYTQPLYGCLAIDNNVWFVINSWTLLNKWFPFKPIFHHLFYYFFVCHCSFPSFSGNNYSSMVTLTYFCWIYIMIFFVQVHYV